MEKRHWEETLKEAIEYEKTCIGGMNRRDVFTPRILYNVLALSAEKYCMTLFYSQHIMPECHTFHDLSNALKETMQERLAPELEEKIKDLDIPMAAECSLDIFEPLILDYGHISVYLETLTALKDLILSELPVAVALYKRNFFDMFTLHKGYTYIRP